MEPITKEPSYAERMRNMLIGDQIPFAKKIGERYLYVLLGRIRNEYPDRKYTSKLTEGGTILTIARDEDKEV